MPYYTLPPVLKDKVLLDHFDMLSKMIIKHGDTIVDLAFIETIDSAGIAMLIEINNLGKSLDHKIYFYNPSPIISDFWNLYELSDLIPFTNNEKNK